MRKKEAFFPNVHAPIFYKSLEAFIFLNWYKTFTEYSKFGQKPFLPLRKLAFPQGFRLTSRKPAKLSLKQTQFL